MDASAAESQLEARVLDALRGKESARPLELASQLGATKLEINRALYALQRAGSVERTESTPPLWHIKRAAEGAGASGSDARAPLVRDTLVVVDLGNQHDCLGNLVSYAQNGLLTVRAYADRGFNGFGINPRLDGPNLEVRRATSSSRNSADVLLIWDLSRAMLEASSAGKCLNIIVATKDLGFQALRDLAEADGHALVFVQGWEELKLHVE